jgi:LysR family transcriptional regulator, regulator for genes of the gallate degradation pathway
MAHTNDPLASIKQLRAIWAVAEYSSLIEASRQLAISQSSLSRQIGEVEQALQLRLFQRGWNGMEPTAPGTLVIAHVRQIISAIHTATKEIGARSTRPLDLTYHLTWFMLDVIDAVDRAGSASGAAHALGISQPTISRTLSQANIAIGRPVFTRTGTGLAPTPLALQLVALRTVLRGQIGQMLADLAGLGGQVMGRVTVGLLPFSEQNVVVEVFARLNAAHPHIQLQAVTGSYTALTDALRHSEIDIILGPLRGGACADWLVEESLFEEKLTLVIRPGHPLSAGFASAEALRNAAWVVGPHGTPTRRFFEAFFLQQGMTPPSKIVEMVTFPLAERMVQESDAIGLLTYSARQSALLSDRLVILSSSFPDGIREIGTTMIASAYPSVPLALFREALKDRPGLDAGSSLGVNSVQP